MAITKKNGTDIGLYVDDVLVAAAQSHELSASVNMIEITSKDSGGDAEYMPGLRSATISCEALYTTEDGDFNQDDLYQLHTDRTEVTLKWGELSTATGRKQYHAQAFLSSWSLSAAMEDAVTGSFEFQLTGPVTQVTIA